jgi:catechol 2,3-dioxygenase-like lactoylglutathione lyase family enzyme
VLDHVGLPVSDFERSKRFYEEALSPLGYELIMEPSVSAAGFGRRGKPDFWIARGDPGHAVHVAFTADDRATVEAFYEAAIAAGGRDNGGPGLRPSTIRATTAPSFSIPIAPTSKLCATGRSLKPGDS